jgi:TetR/AcrR family transcriptional regulator, transcriptional repressor for nem operon
VRRISATTPNAKPVSTTAEQILDVAETLIQTRSYSAFSYQDIADALAIRKASIHYHFATKADLGVAVVDRYVERFGGMLRALGEDQSRSSAQLLDFYCEPYLQFAQTDDRVCLCGALAAETLALPPLIRARVAGFFKDHQAWLARILERGMQRGEFTLRGPAAKTARMFFGALQGALLVKRTTGDMTQLKDVVAALKAQLVADRGSRAAAIAGPMRTRRK